jgi:hypothetical protein
LEVMDDIMTHVHTYKTVKLLLQDYHKLPLLT